MSDIREYSGEISLVLEEEATEPTVRASNDAQWEALRERIRAVLADRGIDEEKWNWRNGHYKHAGMVYLNVRYWITQATETRIPS